MSQTIDDRIVALEFDNGQFEKGVDQTLKTLDKLNESLKLEDAAQGFSSITEASRKVDLSSISNSIDNLSERFSTLRMVGLMALSNIVDGAMEMVKKIGSVLTAPFEKIKTGGWARAMNIENAKFQLKGLGIAWEELSDDIDYAVSGTAYGLDVAAKAAAQFAASGVKAGEDMKAALRGISGVAAMTNTSYEEISDVFTTVAGNMKASATEFNRLGQRGLNARAALKDFFNDVNSGTVVVSESVKASVEALTGGLQVAESDIKDFISGGEISFELFSKALDNAFGEHAKAANDTFTGALSNIGAALSRIGQGFATPFIHGAIPVLNAVRTMVDAIKGTLGETFSIFERLTTVVSKKLTTKINSITNFIKNDFTGLEHLNKALYISVTSIVRIVKTVGEAFKTVFSGSMGDHVNNMAVGMERLAFALQPTEKGLQGLKVVLTVIFTVIKKVGEAVGWIVRIAGGTLIKGITLISHLVFGLIGAISSLITYVGQLITHSKAFEIVMNGIKRIIADAKNGFVNLRRALTDTSTVVGRVATSITSALKTIGTIILTIAALPIVGIYTAFQKLSTIDWSRFVSALKNAKELILQFIEEFKQLPIVQGFIEGVTMAFSALIAGLAMVGTAVKNAFDKLASGEVTIDSIKQKILSIPDAFKNAGAKLSQVFSKSSFLGKAGELIIGIGKKIGLGVTGIKDALKGLTPAKTMLIAFSVSMLSFTLMANKFLFGLDQLIKESTVSLGIFRLNLRNKIFSMDRFKGLVVALAEALLALAASFTILSKIPNLKEVATTIGVFVGAMTMLGLVTNVVDRLLNIGLDDKKQSSFGFRKFVINMAVFSTGILAMAAALKILSNVPLEGILKKVGVLTIIIAEMLGASFLLTKFQFGGKAITAALTMLSFAVVVLAVGHTLSKLNGVDLSGLKGVWPELTAMLLGAAALASALAFAGVTVFAGAIAFIVAMRMFMSNLDKLTGEASDQANKALITVNRFKQIVHNIFAGFKEVVGTIVDELGNMTIIQHIAAVAAIAGIIFVIGKIVKGIAVMGKGFLELSKSGKYIKRVAVSIAIIAAAIAGLIYVAKLMSDWMEESPNMERALMDIGILMLVVAGLMAVSFLADEKGLKQTRKMFTSIGLAFLSLSAFMLAIGTLDEEQFTRANKALKFSLITIGLFAALIAIATSLTKGISAGFGTFAGITLLFSAMIGTLAILMLALKDPQDYLNLVVGIAAIGTVMFMLSKLFKSLRGIKSKESTKVLIALIAGISAVAIAIAAAARILPEEHYIGKIVAISAAMLVVLGALTGLLAAINHFSKDKRFTVTKKSITTINTTMNGLKVFIAGILVIAASLALLQNAKASRIVAMAGILVGVMTALIAIMLAMEKLTKKGKLKSIDNQSLKGLLALTGIFAAIAVVVGVLEHFGGTADRMLATSQVVVLVLAELAAITIGLQKLAKTNNADITSGTLIALLGALTVIFTILGAAIGILESLGGTADRMLATSQVITLVVGELTGITIALSRLAKNGVASLAVIPVLVGLTAIFAALGVTIGVIERFGGTADRMLAVSQVIMLVLAELSAIVAGLGALIVASEGLGILGGIGSVVIIPTLAALTVIFAALGGVIAIIEKVGGTADRMLAVSQVVVLVIFELTIIAAALGVVGALGIPALMALPTLATLTLAFVALGATLVALNNVDTTESIKKASLIMELLMTFVGIMGIFAMLSAGAAGMLAGSAGMAIMVASIVGMAMALKMLEPISYDNISKGLGAVAAALGILLTAGALSMALAPGLMTLSTTILALGVGCLAAGAGVTLFANGLAKLATTTPQQLMVIITAVRSFFTAIGQGVASGLQAIIQVVVAGIKQIKLTAINEAKGFVPDLIKALFNVGGATEAAKKSGIAIGNSWVMGFRNSKLGWHSPPEVIEAFKRDAAASFRDNGDMIKAIQDGGAAAGDQIAKDVQEWTGIIADMDWSDPIGSLLNKTGIQLSDGLGSYQAMLDQFTGYWGAKIDSLSAKARGYGTLADFEYQKQERVAAAWQKYLKLSDEAAYFNKVSKSSEAAKNSAKNAEQAYLDYQKTLEETSDTAADAEDAMNGLADGVTNAGGAASASKSEIQEFQESLRQTLESQMNIFDKFEAKQAKSKEEILANMRSQIQGMADWAGQMNKLATMGIDQGLYKKLAEMGPQGAEYVGAFTQMTAEELAEANNLWAQSITLPGDVAGMVTNNFKALGDGTIDGFVGEVAAREGEVAEEMNNVGQVAYDGIHDSVMEFGSPSKAMINFGFWTCLGLAQGILQNMGHPRRAIETLASVCVSTARARLAPDVFKPIGAGIVDGLRQGIESQEDTIYAKIKSLSDKIVETIKSAKALDVNSPSKKMIPIGSAVSEGLAVGIDKGYRFVDESLTSLTDRAIEGMRYTIATIAAEIEDGVEDPVITPILDLSKVQEGVRTLNGAFNSNKALVTGNTLSDLQNGQYVGSGNVIFNQNNYSPKALSRIDIYRDTRNLFAQAKGALS